MLAALAGAAVAARVTSPWIGGTLLSYSSPIKRMFISDPSSSLNSNVWKIGKINHVAIAVPNIDESMSFYRDILGARVSDIVKQEDHGVYTVFVELGDTKIELLHPLGERSPIENFLQKNKNGGIHHVCLEVENINAALDDLVKKHGIRALSPTTKIGAHGLPVVFLHPKDCGGVLVELEQVASQQ